MLTKSEALGVLIKLKSIGKNVFATKSSRKGDVGCCSIKIALDKLVDNGNSPHRSVQDNL